MDIGLPGSLERIEFYRRQVDSGGALFDDVPDDIPLLPQYHGLRNRTNEGSKTEMKTESNVEMSIDDAITLLTSDDAAQRVVERIENLEAELEKLRRLSRSLYNQTKPKSAAPAVTPYRNPENEAKIVEVIKTHGPMTATQISELCGLSFTTIGKLAEHSELLTKKGRLIWVV